MEKIAIYGCGGHARSVADVILHNDPLASLIFIDGNGTANESIFGFPILSHLNIEQFPFILAIGDNRKREALFNSLDLDKCIQILSKKAHLGQSSSIGIGSFIGNFVHIGPEAIIGKNTIVNTRTIIEHEVNVGNHCHIAPGSVVCGRSTIGNQVFVGAGSTIIEGISICNNVTIGAGSVVIDHILEPGVYVGVPAHKISRSLVLSN